MQKIAIVGAGRVGEATAHFLAKVDACRELALVDVREGVAQGAALDIHESGPQFGFDTRVHGSTHADIMEGAELVVITAGVPRKPGMSRTDVLDTNVRIIDGVVEDVLRYAPAAKLLVVSNPVDVLTYRAWRVSGWPRNRVLGQAGVLDSSRMASFVALETGFSVRDIQAMVLGGHGDSMVPLVRYTTVSGIPVDHFLDRAAIERIVERTRHGGAEILALKQTSSAYGAPAAANAAMVEAIARDRRRILPAVAVLDGEYGEREVAMGVPCVLGKRGVEKVVQLDLSESERALFRGSVESVRAEIARLPE
jgi:malate dehydrogenase